MDSRIKEEISKNVKGRYLAEALDPKDPPFMAEIKPNCFGFRCAGARPACMCLRKLQCSGCKFYKNRHRFQIDTEEIEKWKNRYVLR